MFGRTILPVIHLLCMTLVACSFGQPDQEDMADNAARPGGVLTAQEKTAIQRAVYRRLIKAAHESSHVPDLRPTVFFVKLDKKTTEPLEREFAEGDFIIRPANEADQRTEGKSGRMADSVTGHPAASLQVTLKESQGGKASGVAEYRIGPEWAASFDFVCEKQKGKWVVTQFKMTSVS